MLVVQAQNDIQYLPVIAEVNADVAFPAGACAVNVEHLVAILREPTDHAPTQFPASASNGNPHTVLLHSGWSLTVLLEFQPRRHSGRKQPLKLAL
ncbi:hypothetical protein AAU01_37290 [Paenarthrobacter aurescens]|uniref:Uncharacterized protein n=1 Tax=Paenarthrobacter aurescens TaxID=43663 RepID=A0A4Y3NG33_PAEAU|nr:hypothetical protein AAU01_37290 [Paenarthrobacter aurescens]